MAASGGFPTALLTILALAVALDLALLWLWRKHHRRPADSPARESTEKSTRAGRWVALLDRISRWTSSARQNARELLAIARQEAPRDDLGRLRTVLVAACLLLNASLGYAYAERATVEGWQLWTWLISVVVTVVCLLPREAPPLRWNQDIWVAAGLTAAAAVIRLGSLGSIPPGLHGDESRMAQITLRFVYAAPGESLNPFRSGIYSQPTLYNYVLWVSMRLLGESIAGLRTTSALAGTFSVPLVYLAVARLSGRRAALIASILLVGYHYHVHWSRLALNNIWDTLWIPAMIGLFAWGWDRRWSGGAVLAGLAMGLSQYFYAGSRVGIPLLAFVSLILWRRDRDGRRWLINGTKVLATAMVVAAPLTSFALRQPEPFFDRFLAVLFWRPSLGPGLDPFRLSWLEAAWDQFFRATAGFTSLIETTGFYRPDVPLVMGIAAPLFLAGILWAAVRRRWIPVAWIGLTMFFGGFLLTATPGSSHYVAAIPAVVWLVALPLEALGRLTRPWVAWGLVLAILVIDLYYYFGVYTPFISSGADLNMPFPTE